MQEKREGRGEDLENIALKISNRCSCVCMRVVCGCVLDIEK